MWCNPLTYRATGHDMHEVMKTCLQGSRDHDNGFRKRTKSSQNLSDVIKQPHNRHWTDLGSNSAIFLNTEQSLTSFNNNVSTISILFVDCTCFNLVSEMKRCSKILSLNFYLLKWKDVKISVWISVFIIIGEFHSSSNII